MERKYNKLAILTLAIPLFSVVAYGLLLLISSVFSVSYSTVTKFYFVIIFYILGGVPLSIVTGILAFKKIKKTAEKGKLLVVLGWVISIPVLITVFLVLTLGGH